MIHTEKEASSETIEGKNPVKEALAAGKPIDKIFISESAKRASFGQILALARQAGVPVQFAAREKVAQMAKTGAHQGVVAVCAETRYATLKELLDRARSKDEPPFLVLLDGVTDPHNLGAIIRSANAAGAHGVIIPKNRSAGVNALAAKTSAGAVSYTPVARVTNLCAAIEELKRAGLWVTGADMEGESLLYDAPLSGPMALVVGSEGKGLSRLVKQQCDFLVRIPMLGEIESLNASVAAGVLLYEIVRQRAMRS